MTIYQAYYRFSRRTNLPFEEAAEQVRSMLQDADYWMRSESGSRAELPLHLRIWCEQPHAVLDAQVPPLACEGLSIHPELEVVPPCKVTICGWEGRMRVAATMHERILPVVRTVEEISRKG